jgi:prepilin-type N-terminal cleavage/methylation domain-containing protein
LGDLLTVITIIGILAAPPLPAVHAEAYASHRHSVQIPGEPGPTPYLLLTPPAGQPDIEHPLIVYLYGRGGSIDTYNLATPAYDQFRRLAADRGYYILVPELGPALWMNDHAQNTLDAIITDAGANNPIDLGMVHMMGMSMGGGSSLAYAIHRPDLVRSVCALSGMSDFAQWVAENPAYLASVSTAYGGTPAQNPVAWSETSAMQNLDAFKNIPVFMAHGTTDTIVSPEQSRRLAAALNAKGYDVTLREASALGHVDEVVQPYSQEIIDFMDAIPATPAPEPSSLALLITVLVGALAAFFGKFLLDVLVRRKTSRMVCRCSRKPSPAPMGFTLVELLVVITIIGILIALLLPAVQSAREAARRIQCAGNFKQVGVAMHNYHSAHNCFPPGTINWVAPCGAPASWATSKGYQGWGWGAFLLPHLEQQALYDKFDFNGDTDTYTSPGNPNNLIQATTKLAVYICPTDPQNGELANYTGSSYAGHPPNPDEDVATCNMAGVVDSKGSFCSGTTVKRLNQADGLMANGEACDIARITDGSSNTLMVGEIAGSTVGSHQGRPWLDYNVFSTENGINSLYTLPGGAATFSWTQSGFSSYHPGGCHFLLADGSTQFLSQNIDVNVLVSLTTRAGGEPVTGASY